MSCGQGKGSANTDESDKVNSPQNKDDPKNAPVPKEGRSPANGGLGDGSSAFVVTGSLMIASNLLDAKTPTHIMAYNTETGRKLAFPIDPGNASFSVKLPTAADDDLSRFIRPDGSLDRDGLIKGFPDYAEQIKSSTDEQLIEQIKQNSPKPAEYEPSPWTLAYVDATKTGKEMLISRFASESLDTLTPTRGNVGLDMGSVDTSKEKAETSANFTDVINSLKMSRETAEAFGAVDDSSIRNINPDMDGDGKLDCPVVGADGSLVGKPVNFQLDFHNRFNLKEKNGATSSPQNIEAFTNKFYYESIGGLEKLDVVYQGTGIVPELDKEIFGNAPSSYQWTFGSDVVVRNQNGCQEVAIGGTLASGSVCTQNYTPNPSYPRYQLGMEVEAPPEGTYVLSAGGKTITWTHVKVSDFSAGLGFIIVLLNLETDNKGTASTADDTLKSVSYKYLKKTGAGWVAPTEAELKMLIKGKGAMVSMWFDTRTINVGFSVPKKPSGTIQLGEAELNSVQNNSSTIALMNALKAGTLLYSRITEATVSYDDKLGMRFFF